MQSIEQNFRDEVERFLEATNTKPSTLGWEALKDPGFVSDLRKGRSCSAKTMDRVLAYMATARVATRRRA